MVNHTSQNNKIKEYISIVEKVARVEHRRIPSHMVDYEELVSIGIIAVQAMIKNKTEEQLEKYNSSYIGTAVRWAIRNELRNRYKWYTLKHNKTDDDEEGSSEDGLEVSPGKVREAIYETILSIDSIAAASIFGDLYESMLKRNINVKDSGNILPGHGGMLDRVDGLLFSSVVMLFLLDWI